MYNLWKTGTDKYTNLQKFIKDFVKMYKMKQIETYCGSCPISTKETSVCSERTSYNQLSTGATKNYATKIQKN